MGNIYCGMDMFDFSKEYQVTLKNLTKLRAEYYSLEKEIKVLEVRKTDLSKSLKSTGGLGRTTKCGRWKKNQEKIKEWPSKIKLLKAKKEALEKTLAKLESIKKKIESVKNISVTDKKAVTDTEVVNTEVVTTTIEVEKPKTKLYVALACVAGVAGFVFYQKSKGKSKKKEK